MLNGKKKVDDCYECQGTLKLYEIDMQKGTRIMQCEVCGLFHFYKKDFLAGWKLIKVSKEIH
jgi:hypothetical protein